MKSSSAASQVAVIVRWPVQAPAAVAVQVQRLLSEKRLAATWSIERASQIVPLSSRTTEPFEVAVLVDRTVKTEQLGDEVARRLDDFAAANLSTATVHLERLAERGAAERSLRQLGIALIVADRAAPRTAAPLPFGLWQLAPASTAPASRWLGLFPRPVKSLLERAVTAPAVACIDVGRLAKGGSQPWRSVEQLLTEAADACRRGDALATTLAEIAAQFTRSAAPKPQRSILRAA